MPASQDTPTHGEGKPQRHITIMAFGFVLHCRLAVRQHNLTTHPPYLSIPKLKKIQLTNKPHKTRI